MREELNALREQALRVIAGAADLSALEQVRVAITGRSGSLTKAGEQMRHLAKEERPEIGKLLHEVRTAITGALDSRTAELSAAAEEAELSQIDPTLPGRARAVGSLHPLQHLQRR
ncbi:MAG: phenylalanine--tRNA ligase subunit alpha, partial [Chthoniobacterales bacterium]